MTQAFVIPHHVLMFTADLLATIEAAEIIGVERSTLSRWIDSGRITPAHKLPGNNGAHLFDRSEVERVAAEYALSLEPVSKAAS